MTDVIDFDSIPFTDNYMFQSVMSEKSICKEVIELFLGFKLKDISYPEVEKRASGGPIRRSVRFDVYAEDEEGNMFDIEMENVNHGDLANRSRYYQAMLDVSSLEKGEKGYRKLKRSFIIFLCDFNPFDGEEKLYCFKMRTKNGKELHDGATRIFACTAGEKGDAPIEILEFLSYLKDKKATNGLTRRIEKLVDGKRGSPEWRKEYMDNHWEEWRLLEEGETKGMAKGKAEAEAAHSEEQEQAKGER